MNAWAEARRQDLRELEADLRRQIEGAGWWVSQLIPDLTGDGRWICVVVQEDTGLKLAYTDAERHGALRAAARAVEGRRGRG